MVKTAKRRDIGIHIKSRMGSAGASDSEIVLDVVVHVIVAFVIIATFYPFLYIMF